MKTLKEFKKEIKALGYKVKTRTGGMNITLRFLSVHNQEGTFIVGSGGNVYAEETIKQHEKLFDLLINNRGEVFDTDYNPAIKVLF